MQANTKIERVSTKKLDDVISSQKHFSNKSGLGYTEGSSSSGSVTKEVKFIKAKEQSIVQLFQGHEDLEIRGEIGLVNHQGIEMVIPE